MNLKRLIGVGCLLAVAGLLGVGFLLGGERGAIDWTAQRAVVFESDDWGLAGFIPAAGAWDGLDRTALAPGSFPEVYWGSTLEDSAQVAELAAVLASVRGRDGLPAVLQPNYVMGSQEFSGDRWQRIELPRFPRAYDRPGLGRSVGAACRSGVWYPELHAAWHYDPALRREPALRHGTPRQATERGILLFPGSEQAWELGPWRRLPELENELTNSQGVFARVFGRPAGSVIAPDYTWNARIESMWQRYGLRVIQGKREQRNPDLPRGQVGRLAKLLERRWAKLAHPGRVYLERNCRFEPVQFADPAAVTARCAGEIRAAWRRGEPAIVETHRVNFAHVDPAVPATGRAELARLLADVEAEEPVFLTDTEVAQLSRRGVSARPVQWQGIVLRNGSHSRRIVAVDLPTVEREFFLRDDRPGLAPQRCLVALPAGAAARLEPGPSGWRIVPLP